jgi:hypothetical protein
MNWNSFDRYIVRFNHVMLALFICFFGVMITVSIVVSNSSNKPQPKTESERQEREYEASLSEFEPISGSQFMVARLASESDPYSKFFLGSIVSSASSESASYSGAFNNGRYAARNYLFIDARSGDSHWLVPTNDSLFLAEHQLHEDPNAGRENWKTVAFVYMTMPLVDKSKRSSAVDGPKKLIYYKLADGKIKTLATNVKQLFGVKEVVKQQALILFRDENKNYVMSINTETGDQIFKKELPAVLGQTMTNGADSKPSL